MIRCLNHSIKSCSCECALSYVQHISILQLTFSRFSSEIPKFSLIRKLMFVARFMLSRLSTANLNSTESLIKRVKSPITSRSPNDRRVSLKHQFLIGHSGIDQVDNRLFYDKCAKKNTKKWTYISSMTHLSFPGKGSLWCFGDWDRSIGFEI